MKTPMRSKHAWAREVVTAVATLGIVLAAGPALAVVTLRIGTTDGVPGGTVTLTMSMTSEAGDPTIASAQTDVFFDTSQLHLIGACSADSAECETAEACPQPTPPADPNLCDLACQPDPRLTEQSFVSAIPPFQNVPAGQRRLRLYTGATTFPPPAFADGVLATCVFDVDANASPGQILLSPDRLNVGDQLGNVVSSQVAIEAGFIVVATPTVTGTPPTATPTVTGTPPTPTVTGTPPTPTVTGTPPTPTVTGTPPTPTETGTPPTPTVTGTPPTPTVTGTPPTATPTGTATEIPCVGDCGDDEKVTQADLVIGVGIDLGTTPYEECPQFDRDHSNTVTVEEIVAGVINFALPQCPAPPGG